MRPTSVLLLVLLVPLVAGGCRRAGQPEVIVYAALDQEFAEPILQDFERATGIRVLAKYDVESTKTVGLVNAIIQEQQRPRCDVFWNNEIMHTLRLQKLGLLEPYACPAAENFPAEYRAADGAWYGLAARVRVLLVNTDLVPPGERPTSIAALADERWKGRAGIAKPLFGTTATHAAVLFAVWGEDRARLFFLRVKQNAQVLSGNRHVAAAVGRGELAFGLTDTDDAMAEKDRGAPVELIYPDQGDAGEGALFIPNSLALVKGRGPSAAARRLIDYLLSPPVETQLAEGRSAQFPLNRQVTARSRAAGPAELKALPVDFAAAAAQWDAAARFLRDEFSGP
jgi:iron(III) transport system substrate-binding protein